MKKRIDKLLHHDYDQLLNNVSQRYIKGQSNAIQAVNKNIIDTNWDIGKHIVEFEQNGNPRAKYGVSLLDNLSKDCNRSLIVIPYATTSYRASIFKI
jgi:hypothetical protein